jgi:3-oxoacyl-[acyl-carrier-protein] synthase II
MDSTSRVVVTGIGVVSPIGKTREEFWEACLAGRSGVRLLESPWATDTGLSTRIAATIEGYDAHAAGIELKLGRLIDRTSLFALGAAKEALEDAGLEQDAFNAIGRARIATVIGSGIGGLTSFETSHATWRENRSKHSIKRYSLPMLIPNAPAAQIAIRFGATGECKALSTACAAGTMALGDAWRILARGEADVAIAGGAEGVAGDADCYALLGFDRLRTLSTRNDEPTRASRPFDRERDGFVLGEGSAVLILEREEQARARDARPYAVVSGYAANCDAHSMMQLEENGDSIAALVEAALVSAGIPRESVDYVSAHATSTVPNDRLESRVLRRVFGSRCDEIPVTGLKSMTGHAIASSGPMEVAAAALSIDRGLLTPTINYDYPDPECDVDVVANEPRRRRVDTCLKLSYGFGGHNACLVLTRV